MAVSTVHAGESLIPLSTGLRIPSDDLLYRNQVLSSRDAQNLEQNQKLDLSYLNPKDNDLWSLQLGTIPNDQSDIAINEEEMLSYEGGLASNSGLYRFNAIPVNGNKVFTVHLDKTLHTMLLRKNLLRMLGYKIPAMKYVRKLSIQFNSSHELENFLKREIPEATLGTADRWAAKVNHVNLIVELQDVAISEPNEFDFYNVSMGIPTQTINSRTLRSLIIPYSVLDLSESVNKFSWVNGKIDNKAVILSHFTANEFGTSVDDALWMIRKLNKLTVEDFKSAIDNAYFPLAVGAIIKEKLIARRNSLNRIFSTEAADLPFNAKLTIGKDVIDGKLMQQNYRGYASRFAYGDAESPLDQLIYFLYSKIHSNAFDNLIAKFNEKLVVFDLGEKRLAYFQDQFKKGLDHFVQTGELIPIGVGAWYSPVINAELIFSRDIVLGNYLGTDNMVQLADTFGVRADLGLFVGIEGLGNDLSSSVKVSTSLVRSYTHLKPVKSLKESLKEPYRNMFVNLMKRSLKESFFSLAELKDGTVPTEEKNKQIQQLLKDLDQHLSVGESLLITDRIMPTAGVRLSFTTGMIGAGLGISGSISTIKRIHLYKKSPKVLQIYDDHGFVRSLNLSFNVNNYIPIVKVSGIFDRGNYKIKSYMVNLSGDLKENPELYANALGVYNVLKNKSFELLDATSTPVILNAQYQDKTRGLSFFFWRLKAFKAKTFYDLKAKDGVHGRYFSINKDFMKGFNLEVLSKQIFNYYLSTELEDIKITEEADRHPGESFFGSSFTQSIRYEASVKEDNKGNNIFDQKFISISDVKQGWSLSKKRLIKFMTKVNDKFQYQLFQAGRIDFKKLRLYKIGYHLNIYNPGIERINALSNEDINRVETRYRIEKNCKADDEKYYTAECGDLGRLRHKIKLCKKTRNTKNEEELADCNVEFVERLFNDLTFVDFQRLVGEKHIYVYGSIDGFREKSEILNDTIFSNTIGKIGSKEWNGPLEIVRDLLGLSGGEFSGSWIREAM